MYNGKQFFDLIGKALNLIMLMLFLPVLFCVMFIGNNMDYYDDVKADILVPNALLTLIAFVAIVICMWLISQGRKIAFTKRTSRYLDLTLIVLFIGFYFFCMWLCRETVFDMSVDPGIMREAAKEVAHKIPFGYRYEFSMNYNNLPILYVLGRLYRIAEGWEWFHHNPEYLWIIMGCLMVTAAGFVCCQLVKKLTKNVVAVLLTFLLYLATAGVSPWKGIPYTDSYGILFPILCFFLYFCCLDCEHIALKILLLFLSLVCGMVGGFMKPNAHIAVLAVLGMEGIRLLETIVQLIQAKKGEQGKKNQQKRKQQFDRFSFLLSLLFVGMLYLGNKSAMNYIVDDIQLDYNEEIEATPQYFFFMGTKELTTGSFSIEDYGIFGEFQFSKADRNAACMERAWGRIRERGVGGTIYFCLKKLVKSFNDGSFAWTHVLYYEPFPEDMTHDNILARYMRTLFVPGGVNQGKYDTLAELVWIFTLMGIPGIVLTRKKKGYFATFPIFMIGLLVYLMLFESGARYVYIFLPILIVMSFCGMNEIGLVLRREA